MINHPMKIMETFFSETTKDKYTIEIVQKLGKFSTVHKVRNSLSKIIFSVNLARYGKYNHQPIAKGFLSKINLNLVT